MADLILPNRDWCIDGLDGIAHVLDAECDATRLVGGAVRDTLAGLAVKDIDLATKFPPEEVVKRLKTAGIKVVPTGIAHGTVTAVLEAGPVEITTLRRDVSTDGRRATVIFSDDWREDASRRDFTINALYADLNTGAIHDYFGGVADLASGIVRFIGDPLTRIAEDHLRILRFFRFQARFGVGEPEWAALAACTARANDLMALSRERIADEWLKLLALPDPTATVRLMLETGILLPVLPEIEPAAHLDLARLIVRETENSLAGDATRRFAALLPADRQLVENVATRLKLSRKMRQRLDRAAKREASDAVDPRALAYWWGKESAIDRLMLGMGLLDALIHWSVPRFPFSGKDVIALGVDAGPAVAAILKNAERAWVAAGFPELVQARQILADLIAVDPAKER
jgi:poly(A) polymerase